MGDVILGRLDGTARMAWIAERAEVQMVSVGDELVEAVKWSGRGLAGEWADGRLHETPTLSNMAQTVPVLDDRVMAWRGGLRPDGRRLDGGEHHRGAGMGLDVLHRPPAEWADPAALWIGPSTGDDDNAPSGRNLFSSVGADWCGWSHPRLRRGQHCDRVRQRREGRFRHLAADATLRVRGDCFGLDPVRVRAGERCGRRRPRREPDRAPVVAAPRTGPSSLAATTTRRSSSIRRRIRRCRSDVRSAR